MAEGDVRVPAGWYPDPLGVPQLRWWDNHSWTEYTSDALQPMVAQETLTQQARLAYADAEEVPATTDASPAGYGTEPSVEKPTAEALLSLEAPVREDLVEHHSPASKFADLVPDAAQGPTSEETVAAPDPFNLDTRFDDLLGDDLAQIPLTTTPVSPNPPAESLGTSDGPTVVPDVVPAAVPVAAADPAPATTSASGAPVLTRRQLLDIPTATAAAWGIAMLPIYATLVSAFFLASLLSEQYPAVASFMGIAVPILAGILLALVDARILRRRGLRSPLWVLGLIPGPIYLIVRFVTLLRQTGHGFGPLIGTALATIVAIAGIIAVPGLGIAQQPSLYSHQAASAAVQDARALGDRIVVHCPGFPPTIVGQSFVCRAHEVGSTKNSNVTISLQQDSGFISWRVDDWGSLTVQPSAGG